MTIGKKIKNQFITRDTIVGWESFKEGRLPYTIVFFVKLIFIIIISLGFVFFLNFIIDSDGLIDINVWIPVLLAIQLILITLQLVFIWIQTRIFKLPYEAELIPIIENLQGTNWKHIFIQNYGSTAHEVRFGILTKKGNKLKIGRITQILHTILPNEKKFACRIDKKDFHDKSLTIKIDYYNKNGNIRNEVYKKLPNEDGFFPV